MIWNSYNCADSLRLFGRFSLGYTVSHTKTRTPVTLTVECLRNILLYINNFRTKALFISYRRRDSCQSVCV